MVALSFGLFGLIVGSFLNVLILRRGVKPLSGRSTCVSCGAGIRWYDLIPVVSWVALGGRCRDCRAAISIQYPFVEAGVGAMFALIGAAPIALSFKLLALPIAALFIAIAVYDLYTTIIPDLWVATAGVLTLISALFGVGYAEAPFALALLAGPITALPLFLMWYVSRGRWMGLGDPKLALSLGWLLGIEGGLTAVFLAFIIGALISVPLLFLSSNAWVRFVEQFMPISVFQKAKLAVTIIGNGTSYRRRSLGSERERSLHSPRWTMKSEVPFGPFLVASCFIIFFSQIYGISFPLFL